MFAVIKTGGKQYKVSESDIIEIEKLEGVAGDKVEFPEILLSSDGKSVNSGSVKVEGKIISQTKGPKIIIMKHRRRKNSRRKTGHRQSYTEVEITSIKQA